MHCLKRENKSLQRMEGVKLFPYTISSSTLLRINEIKRMESMERLLKTNSMIALQETKIRD